MRFKKKIHDTYEKIRSEIGELKDSVNDALEKLFTKEDDNLQNALSNLRAAITLKEEKKNDEAVSPAVKKAKAELVVKQAYRLITTEAKEEFFDAAKGYRVTADKEVDGKWLQHRKPCSCLYAKCKVQRFKNASESFSKS